MKAQVSSPARESLGDFFRRLIGERDNVTPDNVDLEYIRRRRSEPWYKRIRFNIGSDYGGYEVSGLRFYTEEEFEKIEEQVDEKFLKLKR